MLTEENKASILWKNYKGRGSTHPNRESFEELYRVYNNISTNSVLTHGNLIPRNSNDPLFEDVKKLDSTNTTVYFAESSFKTLPIVKKHTDLILTKISSNCNHAFAILDENGNQIKNIIPYDYSDTGLYNITLKTQSDEEIPWGSCDWIVDTNSALLTFNNGVPQGISAANPPKLTFYQYIGPVGERHYIDATLFDIESVEFSSFNPVVDFTKKVSSFLDSIEQDFFQNYKFNGTDTTQGIGLQYNILSNITETATNDPVKGYDDNSDAQVVSLMSHKIGETKDLEILFVSEGVSEGTYRLAVESSGEYDGISKINTEDGFFVVKGPIGTYDIRVVESDKISAVLLVKDNETLDYELFFPRGNLKATLKLPVFVDLMKFPPHLKLATLNSYSDHITPQYYGPRVADFVIATDEATIKSRSADFVVYNKQNFYLQDALQASDGQHIFIRNGLYKNARSLTIDESFVCNTFTGETKQATTFEDIEVSFAKDCFVENIYFKNCQIKIQKNCTFKNCIFDNTEVLVEKTSTNTVFSVCDTKKVLNQGTIQIFDSRLLEIENTGTVSIFNTAIINSLENKNGQINSYASYIKLFTNASGEFNLNSCRLDTLDVLEASENSIVNTTNIAFVKNLPETIKLDSSYVTKFSENISREIYPDKLTIPYYESFEKRVYAKLAKPFNYNKKTNEINLLLDSIQHTIYINEKGELQCRFFTSLEISIVDPESYTTQIESIYNEHADTKLKTRKPQNVDEALLDLYWSKADLKNGKVPIDQLPDSVAYGGLSFVGMWSFEDSEGAYPSFADVSEEVLAGMSDDKYSGLQPGWFFIVSASHKEDDPVYPQEAVDGEIYTAGDWIIYKGTRKAWDESSDDDSSKDIENSLDVFEKLDRAYQDPVYSRLPEFATKTGDENPAWSVLDDGTGLLRLSYVSLAEAIRLINEVLFKHSPDRPASIQEVGIIVDEQKSTATKREYLEVGNGLQLNQLTQAKTLFAWDGSKRGRVYFKQKGLHDELPLEHTFYCGTSSSIKVYDINADITSDCKIDRFDPYQRYRLGFRYPTVIDAAEVSGFVTLGKGAFRINHSIKYTQYELEKSPYILDSKSTLEGESLSTEFLERKFYDFADCKINHVSKDTVNLRVLNNLLLENRTGGIGFLPKNTPVVGTFTISNFTKYGTISPDAEVTLEATFKDIELQPEITSQTLSLVDPIEEVYDLIVSFTVNLPNLDYYTGDLTVKAKARNFGVETLPINVLILKNLLIIDPQSIPEIVESAGALLYPSLGNSIDTQFGAKYTVKKYNQVLDSPELMFTSEGYGWPEKEAYANTIDIFDESTDIFPNKNGLDLDDKTYRFVTFKHSFDSIRDLCGFKIHILWNENKPELNSQDGTFSNVILQVCVTSPENPKTELLNGNVTVPVFFEAKLEQAEPCNYAGKSTQDIRRITFGRKPVPVKDIYIRIGVERDSKTCIKGIRIEAEDN